MIFRKIGIGVPVRSKGGKYVTIYRDKKEEKIKMLTEENLYFCLPKRINIKLKRRK